MEQITLSEEDLKSIRLNLEGPHAHLLREMKKWVFNVGDVVVRYHKTKDGKRGPICTVSDTNKAPKKFKVVHIDELGIPHLKIITKDGNKLSQTIMCLANQDHASFTFELDPELAECILMDNVDGYDPMAAAKANRIRRKEMNEHNMKLFRTLVSHAEVNKELENWQRGTVFWFRNIDGRGVAYYSEHTVVSIVKCNNYDDVYAKTKHRPSISDFKDKWMMDVPTYSLEVKVKGGHRNSLLVTKDFLGKRVSLEKPLGVDDDQTY